MKMMRAALLPLVMMTASVASGNPNPCAPPAPPPAAAACATTGDVAVEIDHDAIAGAKLPTSITKLYDTGGWTFVETLGDGKPGRSLSGCLAKDDLAKLTAVEASPWKVTRAHIHCMAMSQTSTAYHVNGKADYVKRTCGEASLDDKSSAALADLQKASDAAVDAATNAHPSATKK